MIGRNYPTLELLTQRPAGVGKVFFVDSGGAADNEGTDPDSPLNTVTEAIEHCTTNKGDCIIMLQNSPSGPPAPETFPIVVDKAGVLIAGLYSRGMLSDSGIGCDEQNVATFEIKAHYVTIEGLYIGCDQLGTTGGIITFNGTNSYSGCAIRNCLFDMQYLAAYGIYMPNDQPWFLVEDCIFGTPNLASFTTAAISLGNCTRGMFRRNLFARSAGVSLLGGTNAGNFSVMDNTFVTEDDLSGEAITLGSSSSGCIVVRNTAVNGMLNAGYSYNPYRDLAANTANHWGMNYRGNSLMEPVGV